MQQIMINLDSPEIKALEKAGDKSAITQVIPMYILKIIVKVCGIFAFEISISVGDMFQYSCYMSFRHQEKVYAAK